MLDAIALELERRGVYNAKERLAGSIKRIIAASALLGLLAYITGFYVVLILIPLFAVMLFYGLFTTGRDYGLVNREAVLFSLHGFILANAGFDVTGIFDQFAKMREYEGSYVFRKIMGYFYFMGMDLREAINRVLQEEKRLGVGFKSFLTSIYNGMTTGIDTRSIFNMVIQQEIIESERNIETFEEFINSFLSGLMPFVIMAPLMLVLLGGVANMPFVEYLFINLALGIAVALILLFSENKFLYYPESIMFSGKVFFIQLLLASLVSAVGYFLIGTYSLFLGILAFFLAGYLATREYVGLRKDTYTFLPVFLADLGGRISIGQTFTEAVTSMPLDIYGRFSRVLKFSLGNLINVGEVPKKRDFERIYVYKIYRKLITDLQKGVFGYEALLNVRTIISLMSTVYEKVRSTLSMNTILMAVSLSFSMLFVDLMAFLGEKVSQSMAEVQQAGGQVVTGLEGLLVLLSFLRAKSWIIDVYFLFAFMFILIFGMFISSVSDGTRHGNLQSIIYAILSMILIVVIHSMVSPALFAIYR